MYDLQDRADDLIIDQLVYGRPGSWVFQLEPLRGGPKSEGGGEGEGEGEKTEGEGQGGERKYRGKSNRGNDES